MQHSLGPRSALFVRPLQLEDRAAALGAARPALVAADVCRPIDCALTVEHQAAVRISPIRATREAVQHLLRPLATLSLRRTQLEYRPAILIVTRVAGRAFASAERR